MERGHAPGCDCTLPISEPLDNLTATGIIFKTVQFGQSVVFGDQCYLKSDGKYWLADASAEATIGLIIMALGTYAADAYGDGLRRGFARNDAWSFTKGERLYIDTTPGQPTQIKPSGTGDQVQITGYCHHDEDIIYFDPDNSYVEVQVP